jgi:GNAT superfamily N-acetyltransferase
MSPIGVVIRPASESDIALLESHFSDGGPAKHAECLMRQQKGEAVYLIAWHQGRPVGHALMKWGGSEDELVAERLKVACPDIGDLFVLEGLRSQGIGSQLLRFAERLARERGYGHIGLSVAAQGNEPARRLYERLGYRDAHFGEYVERAEFLDSQGHRHSWEETCVYLVKDLVAECPKGT